MRGIDEARVTEWLAANVAGAEPPFTFELIAGGHSNLTFKVTDAAGVPRVLRRPPLGHVLATAHDMAREHRIITAVRPFGIPVAETLGLCTDDDVNGAPFYVMAFVQGVVLDSADKAAMLEPEARLAAGQHLIDVLADLHSLDVDEVGLGDLAKREGYVERQLKRWSQQWAASKTRDLPAIDEVEAQLRTRLPVQQGVSVVHGDYRFGNCMVEPGAARIAGVLDWELCTLGDPLADVGYLGVYWSDPDRGSGRHNDPTSAGGFPSYEDLLQRYAARTGKDLSGIEYYRAFSSWRLAVISEGVYARYLHGVMADTDADITTFKTGVEQLAESALDAVHRLP